MTHRRRPRWPLLVPFACLLLFLCLTAPRRWEEPRHRSAAPIAKIEKPRPSLPATVASRPVTAPTAKPPAAEKWYSDRPAKRNPLRAQEASAGARFIPVAQASARSAQNPEWAESQAPSPSATPMEESIDVTITAPAAAETRSGPCQATESGNPPQTSTADIELAAEPALGLRDETNFAAPASDAKESGGDYPAPEEDAFPVDAPTDASDLAPAITVAARNAPAPTPRFDANALDNASPDGETAVDDPSLPSGWSEPTNLRERLQQLAGQPQVGPWAANVLGLLNQMAAVGGPRSNGVENILAGLEAAAGAAEPIASQSDGATAEQLRRTACALKRRVIIWQQVAALPSTDDALVPAEPPEPERLLACLSHLDDVTRSAPEGEGWRRYLLMDRLHEIAHNRQLARDKRRQIAREVLSRLTAGRLSNRQRRFASAHSMLALRSELRRWAAAPVDLDQLMAEIERYEQDASGSSGELIAACHQQLQASNLPAAQRLAQSIDTYYRGANLRLVITDTLLTRMMPQQDAEDEFVREEILGIPTSGHSYRTTNLVVRLVPDPKRLRFVVQANGLVFAKTSTRATGATVWTGMNSTFQIEKPFEMTLQGLRTDASEAEAETHTHLRGVETPLTGVPLVGSMFEGFVRQQYHERRRDAERELRRKVILKAVTQMEMQVERRVTESNEKLRQNVLVPLERLQLQPAVAEMQTSEDRMTLRLRLAADHQLAAQTPRPRAPSNSLASFQVHESVLNNVFNQLDLNGRTFSQADLFRWVAQRLNRPADSIPENLREDVFLTFAPSDSFRVRAKNGQLEINLALDELRAEGSTYRDFLVRVFYRPDEAGGRGELVRDGVVQLIGKTITLRGQVALRGIFSKTFPREKRFSLLPKRLNEDPRLADIRVTQMVVTDGWLGIALGEDRVASSAGPLTK